MSWSSTRTGPHPLPATHGTVPYGWPGGGVGWNRLEHGDMF